MTITERVADWHAGMALKAYRKRLYKDYARHIKIADNLRNHIRFADDLRRTA